MAKKGSKMSKFVELSKQGLSIGEIATAMKISTPNAYAYRSRMRKDSRGKKAAKVSTALPAELSAFITRLGTERLREMLSTGRI